MAYRVLVALIVLALASCAAPPPEPMSLRVRWGLTGESALPASVVTVEIVTCSGPHNGAETCDSSTCSVNALTLMSEVAGCRPRVGTDMFGTDPVLVRTGLPTNEPIRFELRGKGAADELLYVGHAGPFVLGEGERRFVDLQMYEVGRSSALPGSDVSRFLHTSTLLPDGRVLVAGGFTRAQRVDCDEAIGFPEGTRCFDLEATAQAVAIDPSSGAVAPVRSGMLAARAGHSATALPDGRVLVAGGASRALLAMVPQGVAAAGGYALMIIPQRSDGSEGALDSFELFDAYLDGDDDPDRDGDIGRGRFLGAVGQTTPGPLNVARFLHAAAVVPSSPGRVLLAGGMGDAESAQTYEIFDNARTGGYGVYAGRSRLATPRVAPSAVGVGERVWIFGGASAVTNADLAEIWTADGTDPNGSVEPASEGTAFPASRLGLEEERPEYALLRPGVATVDGGARPLVLGWYGPLCDSGVTMPRFADGSPLELCNSPGTSGTRSFTVDPTSGAAAATSARPRSLGAVAETSCFRADRDERYVVATGGAANTTWVPQNNIDVFDGLIEVSGAAARRSELSLGLSAPRIFHTSTGVAGLGVLSVGGITFSSSVDQVLFQRSVEILFVPRPDDRC